MIKKIIKRITMITIFTLLLITANCFGATMKSQKTIKKDNVEYIKRVYLVPTEEENDFLMNLEKNFKIDKKNYELETSNKSGGDKIEKIDLKTSKTINTNTDKLEEILNELEQEIKYEENGFIGSYKLDINSINIEKKYNGYKEVLTEETKIYTDLDTNDLDNIPKQIMKNGMLLDLITTNWEITETRNLQDNEIPNKYKAICYYASKKKVDNPLTYIVKADYIGIAEKVIKNDYSYEIMYK